MKYVFMLAALLVLSAPVNAEEFSGKVTRVIDGDTIRVKPEGEKKTVKIRLYGIAAPELTEASGVESRRFLKGLVSGRRVKVSWKKKDRYKRIIGKVFVLPRRKEKASKEDCSMLMVGKGWARWYCKYAPKDTSLKTLEEYAKKNKLGIWANKG